MQTLLNPASPLTARLSAIWSRWRPAGSAWLALPGLASLNLGSQRAVTVVTVGARCAVVRLEAQDDGLHLVAAEEGELAELARWQPLFRGSRGVLVLRSEERFLLTLDKPEVPDADLNLAMRWPMGEALSTEAEHLLTAALPLPSLNRALRAQVLGVASKLDATQAQLASLRRCGIELRSIDVIDSALRGMALLQNPVPASTVAVCLVANHVSIGLIQQGALCALRSVPLPERLGQADAELAEQLALNTRRTFDHYERQAMLAQRGSDGDAPMAVGRTLASVASLSQTGMDTFCTALPDAPQLFDLGSLHCSEALRERCKGNDEYTALACVAVARLHDLGLTTPLPAAAAAKAAA